jgi:hypothetical protein
LDAGGDRLGWLVLSEDDYREASFLDERLLAAHGPIAWSAWRDLWAPADRHRASCDYIFHIGHVGSTLLSRLLGASARVFGVREPKILRDLAPQRSDLEARLGLILPLLCRTWRPEQRTLIKATSFVNVIAAPLMAAAPQSRALLMFSAPQIHMAGLLAGEGSQRDLLAMAPVRLARLNRRLGVEIDATSLSMGEMAALAWACEILCLADLAARVGARAAWLDFDRFLSAPRAGLAAILTHYWGDAPADDVERMINSPDFGRYAKDRDYAFDPATRQAILAAAQRTAGPEINRGLAWLNALGTTHDDFAKAARAAALGRLV